ncbi:MAG: VCBS repeat-containing protein, partial [Candidatus Aminicenantes bacterium]|nr:VCBS repeat-containing protein [Candidatus Aminicenantes bacterium]
FDADGDIDIVGGTVNDYDYLVYYINDGTGNYTRNEIIIPDSDATGTVATAAADFNQDGRIDIFGATDRWNAGNEARMWLMINNGVVGEEEPELQIEFRCLNDCDPILPPTYDVDMSAHMDFDLDGDMDVILADANHSGDFFLVINEVASVYALAGEARSTNMAGDLDPNLYAITKVTVSDLDMDVTGGSNDDLAVELYVSNNGHDWELYQSFEEDDIRNYTDLPQHTFINFGTHLYWKAIFTAEEDDMEEYDGASFETPRIAELRMEYVFVERREYSRTSVAVASFYDEDNKKKKLLVAGTFIYPGWQGQLRAYDVTEMSVQSGSSSSISTITRSDLSDESGRELVAEGVKILWDAGQLLDARSAANRTIYTAIPSRSRKARLDFSVSS